MEHNKGPLTVAAYMAQASHQYYTTMNPLGVAGDFTTAPEISQMFGELLGLYCLNAWQGGPFALVELGPGRGTLMKDFLRAARINPSFIESLNLHLVEISPLLKSLQKEALDTYNPTWHDTIDSLPKDLPLMIVANEFFDCLPIHQYVLKDGNWIERTVIEQEGLYRFDPPGDTIRESCPAAIDIIRKLGNRIHIQGGLILIIDYGYMKGEQGDTLQALKNHTYWNPLETPGHADITAHIDFKALQDTLEECQLKVSVCNQGKFLCNLGILNRLAKLQELASPEARASLAKDVQRLIHPDHMGSLFKVLVGL